MDTAATRILARRLPRSLQQKPRHCRVRQPSVPGPTHHRPSPPIAGFAPLAPAPVPGAKTARENRATLRLLRGKPTGESAMQRFMLLCLLLLSSALRAEHGLFVDDFETRQTTRIDWLSDEFDDPASLAHWTRHWQIEGWPVDQLQYLAIEPQTAGGSLVMRPHSSGWWQDYRGELTFQRVSGDFIATVRVRPRNTAGTGAPGSTHGGAVETEYSLGGIMARAARPDVEANNASWVRGGERYVFLSMGSADQPGVYQFEDKTTRAALPGEPTSWSVRLITNANTATANLRLARIGQHVIALVQPVEPPGAWQVLRRFNRADFPETLQLGLVAYTDYATVGTCTFEQHNVQILLHACTNPSWLADPDLLLMVEFFRLRRPQVPGTLIGADLSNPAAVSDAQLIDFLGFDA
jgi:hypothetical protein